MTITLNWGILGAGNISGQFVHDLLVNNVDPEGSIKHTIISVGSSSASKGEDFIKSNGIKTSNNNGVEAITEEYDDFYKNGKIDIVYVGTPHTFHKEQVTQCLENGKHVLVEKPITLNAKDARELIELAKVKNKFLMEGVWTRFFPSVELIREHIFEKKTLGEVYKLFADFSMNFEVEKLPTSLRGRDIKLGAGATLDIGIYSVTYGRILLDDKLGENSTPFDTKSFLSLDPTDKVDHDSTILIKYENGKQGILTSSNHTNGPDSFVRLEGTEAVLEMWSDNPARPKNFKITFTDKSKSPIVFEEKNDYNGFIYEANSIAKEINEGKIESSVLPWSETLLVMGIMDKARLENGLIYPQEK
ncbi:hypothetical protein QCA50_015751 [Cerrena zonata]|uniref:D-xylose 1-dehydrogenase (NADP(+), D-xylono-1,5-lactone-forming) n=1 Tax=Cerrena zonata TaxID=2478898 RepID=A0AAW0FUZ8_9APHY